MISPTRPLKEYTLYDIWEANRQNPRYFLAPTDAEVNALIPGKCVQLLFVLASPPADGPLAERMWVTIIGKNRSVFTGRLDSEPQFLRSVNRGDELEFNRKHIASILAPPQFDEHQRALITRAALINRQVNRAVKIINTSATSLTDISGWQLMHGGESPADLESMETSTLIPLEEVLSFEPLLERVFSQEQGDYVYSAEARAFIPNTIALRLLKTV